MMQDGLGAMIWVMGLVGLIGVALLILAIAAWIKYLRSS